MTPVPGEVGIFPFTAWKRKLCPGLNRTRVSNRLRPVLHHILYCQHFLLTVRSHSMIEHNIGIDFHFRLMQSCHGFQIFCLCSIFRSDGPFLIKFSQIIGIIHAITDITFPTGSFISRRQPDPGKAQFRPAFRHRRTTLPMLLILRQIPLKRLQQCFIFQSVRLLS